jgi:NitT/TauT family transport system ATP-binding protein
VAIDKRRRDPQAPHRYGSTAVYDFPLDKKEAGLPHEAHRLAQSLS